VECRAAYRKWWWLQKKSSESTSGVLDGETGEMKVVANEEANTD
jgi:hypothetical protein